MKSKEKLSRPAKTTPSKKTTPKRSVVSSTPSPALAPARGTPKTSTAETPASESRSPRALSVAEMATATILDRSDSGDPSAWIGTLKDILDRTEANWTHFKPVLQGVLNRSWMRGPDGKTRYKHFGDFCGEALGRPFDEVYSLLARTWGEKGAQLITVAAARQGARADLHPTSRTERGKCERLDSSARAILRIHEEHRDAVVQLFLLDFLSYEQAEKLGREQTDAETIARIAQFGEVAKKVFAKAARLKATEPETNTQIKVLKNELREAHEKAFPPPSPQTKLAASLKKLDDAKWADVLAQVGPARVLAHLVRSRHVAAPDSGPAIISLVEESLAIFKEHDPDVQVTAAPQPPAMTTCEACGGGDIWMNRAGETHCFACSPPGAQRLPAYRIGADPASLHARVLIRVGDLAYIAVLHWQRVATADTTGPGQVYSGFETVGPIPLDPNRKLGTTRLFASRAEELGAHIARLLRTTREATTAKPPGETHLTVDATETSTPEPKASSTDADKLSSPSQEGDTQDSKGASSAGPASEQSDAMPSPSEPQPPIRILSPKQIMSLPLAEVSESVRQQLPDRLRGGDFYLAPAAIEDMATLAFGPDADHGAILPTITDAATAKKPMKRLGFAYIPYSGLKTNRRRPTWSGRVVVLAFNNANADFDRIALGVFDEDGRKIKTVFEVIENEGRPAIVAAPPTNEEPASAWLAEPGLVVEAV